LLLGMLAWVLRYVLFAYGNAGELTFMLIIGIALHGICYDFFFVSGQIYTNARAGEKNRSAAQGLITLATYGIGMLIGFYIAGVITDTYRTANNLVNWNVVWLIPAGIAALVMILFALFFKENKLVKIK
jgi:MFS family permease